MIRAILIGITALAATPAMTQSVPKAWVANRMPDGQPDLQGTWTNVTITPLERPRELGDQEFFTVEEQAAYEQRMLARRDQSAEARDSVADPSVWWERGTAAVGTRRTSLIIDPADGRIPALTPEAQKRMADLRAETRRHPADGPRDRSLQERCILSATSGPPMLPGPYNNNIEIVQTPAYVMMTIEMIHDVRVIPLDSRPHVDPKIRQWLGDSRGHWENGTLVVDTTNFTDKTHFRGSDENLHLIERFTRVGPDTILYRFTIDDPSAFTRQWTGELPLLRSRGAMYEFACHEGNVAMEHILGIARQQEKEAAAKEK